MFEFVLCVLNWFECAKITSFHPRRDPCNFGTKGGELAIVGCRIFCKTVAAQPRAPRAPRPWAAFCVCGFVGAMGAQGATTLLGGRELVGWRHGRHSPTWTREGVWGDAHLSLSWMWWNWPLFHASLILRHWLMPWSFSHHLKAYKTYSKDGNLVKQSSSQGEEILNFLGELMCAYIYIYLCTLALCHFNLIRTKLHECGHLDLRSMIVEFRCMLMLSLVNMALFPSCEKCCDLMTLCIAQWNVVWCELIMVSDVYRHQLFSLAKCEETPTTLAILLCVSQ